MNVFQRFYKRYDAWYDRNHFAYLSELAALKKAIPKKGRGLEIGVGSGRFAAPLNIEFGIDPSGKMLWLAQARGIKVKLAKGESLPFQPASFDYVAIIITLCFVRDPLEVLRQARRVLKKNGAIIVGIIDKESFLGRLYQRKKSLFYKQAKFFKVAEVDDLLNAAGFRSIAYYQAVFKLPAKIDSIEKPRPGFGKGAFVVIKAKKQYSQKRKIVLNQPAD